MDQSVAEQLASLLNCMGRVKSRCQRSRDLVEVDSLRGFITGPQKRQMRNEMFSIFELAHKRRIIGVLFCDPGFLRGLEALLGQTQSEEAALDRAELLQQRIQSNCLLTRVPTIEPTADRSHLLTE